MSYTARLQGTATIIAADLNFNLDVMESYPTAALISLARGDLVDLDKTWASVRNTDCVAGYSALGGAPTRIDGVLADVHTAGRLVGVSEVERLRLPGHRAVRYALQLERACQTVLKMRRMPAFEVVPREKAVQDDIARLLLQPHEAQWEGLLASKDVDALWRLWSWLAEEVGLALSCPELRGPGDVRPLPFAPLSAERGRGTPAMVKEAEYAPLKPGPQGGPRTTPLMRVMGALGALRVVVRWGRQRALAMPVGQEEAALRALHLFQPPQEVLDCWRAACRKCEALDTWLLRHATELRATMPALCRGSPPLPSLAAVVDQYDGLVRLGRAQARAEGQQKVREWRAKMDAAWVSEPGKVYEWIRG